MFYVLSMPDVDDTQKEQEAAERPQMVIAPPPTGISALRQAVDFVARGRPVSAQMIDSLERMLSNTTERLDLLQTVFLHVQVERLRNLLEGMSLVESRVFHPAMVANYNNRELLDLLKAAQSELRAISTYLDVKSARSTQSTPESVKDVADPAKAAERKEAEVAVGALSPKQRSNLRTLLDKLSNSSESKTVIEVAHEHTEPTT